MKAAIEYLKQNALNIACFFGLSGAALFALLGEGASMAAEYPVPSIALALAALCIGACVGNAVAKRRANKELQADYDALTSKRAAKLDKLARTFACMPESSKKLVAEALDNGECIVTVADMPRLNAAAALAENGIFWSPRTASDRFPIHISPECITEIREHRSEWLGM